MLEPTLEALQHRLDMKSEFVLNDRQITIIAGSAKQEWFNLIQTLMEEELRSFNVRLMNTPVTEPAKVLAHHVAAQTVTQWYVGFMHRIAEQIKIDTYSKSDIGSLANPERPNVSQDFE